MRKGQQFDNYTITDILGKGGMGTVGKAVDAQGNVYAIKQILPEIMNHRDAIARFEREKRIQTVLNHPNLLPLIDSGSVDGLPYFVMPFVEGISLSQRLQRGKLKFHQAQVVVRDIGNALAAAHEKSILHRDIKPGNIMLHPEGRALLTDFGIASDPDPNPQLRTKTINVSQMGTSDYMAPEVLHGQRATIKSEIYSFGVTIYEMLTGVRYIIALYQSQDNPWNALPPDVANVLRRATSMGVADRHNSIAEFTHDLTTALSRAQNERRRANAPTEVTSKVSPKTEFFSPNASTHSALTPAPVPSTPHPVLVISATLLLIALVFIIMLVVANNTNNQNAAQQQQRLTETANAEILQAQIETQVADTQTVSILLTQTAIVTRQTEQAIISNLTQQAIIRGLTATSEAVRNATTEALPLNATAEAFASSGAVRIGTTLYTQRDTFLGVSVGERSILLPRGSALTVTRHPTDNGNPYEFNGYYHVLSDTVSFTGWVPIQDVGLDPPLSFVPTVLPNGNYAIGQIVFIDASPTDSGVVYLQPTAAFSALSTPLSNGVRAAIIGSPEFQVINDVGQWWWQIRLEDGRVGYIEDGYLSPNSP